MRDFRCWSFKPSVGLSCGGEIEVLVEKHWALVGGQQAADVWEALQEAVEDDRPAVLFTRKGGDGGAPLLVYPAGEVVGNWGALTEGAVVEAKEAYAQRRNGVVELAGEAVFVQVLARRDKLIVVGAVHCAEIPW